MFVITFTTQIGLLYLFIYLINKSMSVIHINSNNSGLQMLLYAVHHCLLAVLSFCMIAYIHSMRYEVEFGL